METVFPLAEEDVQRRRSLRSDPRRATRSHMHSIHGPRNSVMLIRLRLRTCSRAIAARGPGVLPLRRLLRLLEDLHAHRLPDLALRGSRPTAFCARATSRSSTHCSTVSRSSVRPPAHCRSCRSPSTKRVTSYAEGNFIEPVGPAFWERKS